MEIYRELYQISKDLQEFTNKASMLHDILKGDKPIKLEPGEVVRFQPDWEQRFDNQFVLPDERYGGIDKYGFYIKANPEAVKDFIRQLLKEQHLVDSIEPDDV